MKISSIFSLIFIIGIGLFFLISSFAFAQHAQATAEPASERWDLQMIKEAPIWKNLLVNYAYADHKKFWPERKKALETILEQFPESRWADDAALVLACGKASFENNMDGAISALKKVAEIYPYGRTIVVEWDPQDGCRFDDTWLMWQGSLVFLNPDGTARTSKPFHRYGEISPLEKEALAYFNHLDQFPRSTKVTAQFFISEMLGLKGDKVGAVAVLEEIVSRSASYLPQINKADRGAASQPEGYYTRGLTTRPEYRAYFSLIGYYEKLKKIDKAKAAAVNFYNSCSSDGWLWAFNRYMGDFYERHNLWKQAEEQYQTALKGLMMLKGEVEKRKKQVGASDFPDNFWEDCSNTLETKLKTMKKAGEKDK
jgi:tetratricopeptide (TPR) repeat protein